MWQGLLYKPYHHNILNTSQHHTRLDQLTLRISHIMANITSLFLALLFTIFCIFGTVEPASRARAFVEKQCQSTRYPKLCVQCLLVHVNSSIQTQEQLAQIALTLSLAKARYTRAYVVGVAKQLGQAKTNDNVAVRDCLDQINDGIAQIAQSIKEFRQMSRDGEQQFIWHESNVQSWVSAALTDASICLEGFSGNAIGGRDKAIIKAKVLNVAQLTSNALALFNGYSARHRASFRAVKKP